MRGSERRLVVLFLCGDLMTGRGVDQILPFPSEPQLYESAVSSPLEYVELAERVSGRIPRHVGFDYIWGDALAVLEQARPDGRIVNLETAITASARACASHAGSQAHSRSHRPLSRRPAGGDESRTARTPVGGSAVPGTRAPRLEPVLPLAAGLFRQLSGCGAQLRGSFARRACGSRIEVRCARRSSSHILSWWALAAGTRHRLRRLASAERHSSSWRESRLLCFWFGERQTCFTHRLSSRSMWQAPFHVAWSCGGAPWFLEDASRP